MLRLYAPLLVLGLLPVSVTAQGGTPPALDAHGDPLPPGAVARLGTIRLAHPGGLTALAFSTDGKRLASGGPDRIVRVWEVTSGRLALRLASHADAICAVVFLRDGKTLISGSKDGAIVLWNVQTGERVRGVVHLGQPLTDLAVSPDGKVLISVGGNSVALWEAPTARYLRAFPPEGISRVAFSPDGKRLAKAAWAGAVWTADADSGKLLQTFPVPGGGDAALVSAVFAGKWLVGADTRGKVHVFDAATARVLRSFKAGVFALHARVAASPDGKLLAVGAGHPDVSLRVYDTDSGREHWSDKYPAWTSLVAFSPDGKVLAAGDDDGKIRLWHAESGKPLHPPAGHAGPVLRAALTGDGAAVLTAGADGTVRVWDRSTGRERHRALAGLGALAYLAVTPDGKILAARGDARRPRLYDLERGHLLKEFADAEHIALSPDGTRYALVKRFETVVRERATDRELARYPLFPTSRPVFSPDNRLFGVALGQRGFDVLDARTGKPVLRGEASAWPLEALAFSPDGKRVAATRDEGGPEVWDIVRKTRTGFLDDKLKRAKLVAFSADSALLAWDGPEAAVCLGEVATGKERLRLRGHEAPVTDVVFTKDGRFLVSSSRDGTALVWDLPRLLRDGQPAPKAVAQKAQPPARRKDIHGELLPLGALARMGTGLWCAEEGAQILGFTPDSKGAVVHRAGPEGPLEILDFPTGKPRAVLEGGRYLSGQIYVATRGRWMLVSQNGSIDVWDLPARRRLRRILTKSHDTSLALSPDGKTAAAANNYYGARNKPAPVRLWDLTTGKELASLEGHRTPVLRVAFSADGKRLLSCSPEQRVAHAGGKVEVIPGLVRVWDVATRKPLADYANPSYSFVFSPDGRFWAYLGQDNRLRLMDVAGGKEVAQLPMGGSSDFVFSPDGNLLATTAYGQPIRLYDTANGREVRHLDGQLGAGYPNLHFTPDGKTLACVVRLNWATQAGNVRLWDVASGQELWPYAAHHDAAACAAYSPDGKRVLTGGKDGSLFLWEAATGGPLHRLEDHKDGVSAVAFAPDGKTAASGGGDGQVRLWRVADGKPLRRLDGPGGAVLALTFSADGKSVWACGAAGKLQGWNVTGGARGHFVLRENSLHTAAFSADGALLAYVQGFQGGQSAGGVVHVCRVSSGRQLYALDLRGRLKNKEDGNNFLAVHGWAVAFSADGRLLATGESIQTQGLRLILSNHTVRVWELATGKEVLNAAGLPVPPRRIALSPTGWLLAHGHGQMRGFGQGQEQAVVLRDLSSGQDLFTVIRDKGELVCLNTGATLRPLRGHAGGISCVAFAPDRKRLLTGGADGSVMAWETAAFVKVAKPAPVRLSPNELQTLWGHLTQGDAALAYQAIGRLQRSPEQAVALVKQHLKPAPGVDQARVAKLIADLEAKGFATRQKAFTELARYEEQAEYLLRQALTRPRALEAQRRIQQLLDRLDKVALSPELLRTLRALTVLERVGTPEARRVLETLAGGAPTRLTQEAQAALRRWAR